MKIRKFLTRWKLWTNSAFVTNLGPNLAQGITSTASHNDYLFGNFPQSIFFNLETEHEVIDIASMFQWGKAASYDNISMSRCYWAIYKLYICPTNARHQFVFYSWYLSEWNENCSGPSSFWIWRQSSFFQLQAFLDPSLFLGILIEDCIPSHFCLLNLNEFKILCDNQYGFRKSHSTSLALIDLYEEISSLSMVKNTPLECS